MRHDREMYFQILTRTNNEKAHHSVGEKTSDRSDISDGWAQVSDGRFHEFVWNI